ncbi:hypothetical protein ACLQ29_18540 [Micromonospora sp. DT228]|uniref:hypothetical protein n=1 Tax=Micromonospora sp. DT228 TaxID=3393443 RepID=UPI003CE72D53
MFWYFEANDPYVEDELLGSGPAIGILLALLGCLLIPLAGALPDDRKRSTAAEPDHQPAQPDINRSPSSRPADPS